MKNTLVTLAAIAALATPLVAQGSKESGGAKSPSQLVISTWGLSEDALWSEVYEPFEKANNAKITLDTGNGQERYTRLLNDPNSTIDVIELAQKNTADGVLAGAFDPIKPEEIADFDSLLPAVQDMIKSGSGAPYTLNSIGLVYDPKTVGFEIKNWSDLWDPRLAGKVAIPNITTTFGPALLAMCSDVAGVDWTTDGGETAFKQLEALKANVANVYAKGSDVANQLANGEVGVAVIGDFGLPVCKKADPDAVYIVPADMTYANFNVINITKKCRNRDLAVAYINYRLSVEAESRTCKTDVLNEAPVNTKVQLSEADAKNKTVGDIAARAKMVDFTFVNRNLAGWVDRFNRLMAN